METSPHAHAVGNAGLTDSQLGVTEITFTKSLQCKHCTAALYARKTSQYDSLFTVPTGIMPVLFGGTKSN